MHAGQLRDGCERRFAALDSAELRRCQSVEHGAQSRWPLGVARGRIVADAGFRGEENRRHRRRLGRSDCVDKPVRSTNLRGCGRSRPRSRFAGRRPAPMGREHAVRPRKDSGFPRRRRRHRRCLGGVPAGREGVGDPARARGPARLSHDRPFRRTLQQALQEPADPRPGDRQRPLSRASADGISPSTRC